MALFPFPNCENINKEHSNYNKLYNLIDNEINEKKQEDIIEVRDINKSMTQAKLTRSNNFIQEDNDGGKVNEEAFRLMAQKSSEAGKVNEEAFRQIAQKSNDAGKVNEEAFRQMTQKSEDAGKVNEEAFKQITQKQNDTGKSNEANKPNETGKPNEAPKPEEKKEPEPIEYQYFFLFNEMIDFLVEESNSNYTRFLKDNYGENYRNVCIKKKNTSPFLYIMRGIAKYDLIAYIGINIYGS